MSEKRKRKPLEELDVIDDFLFYELMNNPSSAQLLERLVIERALGMKIGKLVIEAQKVVNGMDTDYEKLPELWSIWILPYDPFKANRMIYFVKNTVEDLPEIVYNDGITKVFLYTRGTLKGSESLKSLLDYIHNTTEQNASDSELKQLHTQVQSIKHQKDIGVKYMRLMDSIERQRKLALKEGLEQGLEQGLKQGLEQRRLSSIDKLLKVLEQKGTVPEVLKEKVTNEQNMELIDTWFDLSLQVNSMEEFIKEM